MNNLAIARLISDANAIAHGSRTVGLDPQTEARLFASDTIAYVRRAVALAQHRFGLSVESEWARDFLNTHRHLRREVRRVHMLARVERSLREEDRSA